MRKTTIAILGTRGIPNQYGGFEQFAQYLSVGLVARGFEVSVYNPHNHVYTQDEWEGVKIIRKFDPEFRMGTVGQFIYDLNCIMDGRKRKFDIIYQLGYTSSSIWSSLFPKHSMIVTNMDGLEWKRTKYNKITQRFLRYAERVAVRKSHQLVADSLAIKRYLSEKFGVSSQYIPYGATIFDFPEETVLRPFGLKPYSYDMLIARLEPENSIEMILDGFAVADTQRSFMVVANCSKAYGRYLTNKYKDFKRISFLGPIYEMRIINNLRYFSNLYFHGHTVGGTNPSLLEAMASHALVAANRNDFNASILEGDAYYFSNSSEVEKLVSTVSKDAKEEPKIKSNLGKISALYSWNKIIDDYDAFFKRIIQASNVDHPDR